MSFLGGAKDGKHSKYVRCKACRQISCKNPACTNKITARTEMSGWCSKCKGLTDTRRLLEMHTALGGG